MEYGRQTWRSGCMNSKNRKGFERTFAAKSAGIAVAVAMAVLPFAAGAAD
jgi:hypothetical protein